MASGPACRRVRAEPFSSAVVPRAVAASAPKGRPYAALRGRAEFARVYRTGFRRHVGGIVVISAVAEDGPPRVGVVAGRKVGGAVVRNRAKRRLREAVARAELRPGTAYVVVASAEVAEAAFDDLVSWVRRGAQG